LKTANPSKGWRTGYANHAKGGCAIAHLSNFARLALIGEIRGQVLQ